MRWGLDWQWDLLDSTQLHNSWLHLRDHCKTLCVFTSCHLSAES
jgi:hypothetical protein